MIGIDDIDKVIKLLEENDWEEGQAVNSFYAQEAQGNPGPGANQFD